MLQITMWLFPTEYSVWKYITECNICGLKVFVWSYRIKLTSDSLSLEEPKLPKLWLEQSLFVKVCTGETHLHESMQMRYSCSRCYELIIWQLQGEDSCISKTSSHSRRKLCSSVKSTVTWHEPHGQNVFPFRKHNFFKKHFMKVRRLWASSIKLAVSETTRNQAAPRGRNPRLNPVFV